MLLFSLVFLESLKVIMFMEGVVIIITMVLGVIMEALMPSYKWVVHMGVVYCSIKVLIKEYCCVGDVETRVLFHTFVEAAPPPGSA